MNIIVQKGYNSNTTLKKMLTGIGDKTPSPIKIYSSETEINNNESIAIVIGIDKDWKRKECCNLFNRGIHPIVVFPSDDITSLPFSYITTDDFFTFYHLTKLLISHSKKRVVIAGVNPASATDNIKLNGFKQALSDCKIEFCDDYVFMSNDNISECVKGIIDAKDSFDCVICVNDIIAILTSTLINNLDNYNITGFSGMMCTKYTKPKITTIGIDYYQVGCAIVEAYTTLKKNDFLLKQSFFIKSNLMLGETTPALINESFKSDNLINTNSYNKQLKVYDDIVFKELDTIEILLQKADEIDFKIIKMLVEEKTYEEISAGLFLSITPLKYRINKMLKLTQFSSKSKLVSVLKKYNMFV
ncbi:MAG: hypothetical protein E7404_06185 [Ruminococcaceae bacterium]|nr:hypothetical protein [Oscillospiraceae bacterium]